MSRNDPIPMTAAGRLSLEVELAHLTGERRPEIVSRISTTRDEGDLKENAGYHQAREDQSIVEGRIQEIEALLRLAVIIEEGSADGAARLGSTVTVRDEFGETMYHLVGPTEVDVATGRISADSPVGQALIGAREGSEVVVDAPNGARTMRVTQVG